MAQARLHLSRTPSRTSTSAGRRCCAPRPRTTTASPSWSTRRLRHGARRARPRRRQRLRGDAPAARDQGVRAHRALRRRDRGLPRPRHRATAPSDVPRPARRCSSASALDLRYGENPHQHAAFYVATDSQGASVGSASQLQGKELSFNNLADADAALECVRQFEAPACVIVKHANPCGVAVAASLREAYDRAFRTDPDLRVRRHHRLQPPARRRDGARHRRAAVRRGDRRAAVERRGARGLRQEEERARARHRRARAEQLALRDPQRERRPAGAGPRHRHGRRATSSRSSRSARPPPAELDDLLFAWASAST